MTATTNRPSHSMPTVTFPDETRTVANTGGALVCFTESDKFGVDYSRMTVDTERDFLIFPSWSDGTEHLFVMDRSESVTFAPVLDDDGNPGMGLTVTYRIPVRGEEGTWTIDGYARVMRHGT